MKNRTADYLATLEQSKQKNHVIRSFFNGVIAVEMIRKAVFLTPTPRTAIVEPEKVKKKVEKSEKICDIKIFR